MAITKPLFMNKQDSGFRLVDGLSIEDAIINLNSISATYAIAAAGTNQATSTALNSVLNQVDTTTASSGVSLPLSTGKRNTPFSFCIIYNNGANPLSIYGAIGSTDTINGVAGSTAQTIPVGASALFNSAKPGSWFTGDVSDAGIFTSVNSSGNITITGLGAGFVNKAGTNGRAGTFILTGATPVTIANTTTAITDTISISLNTVGGSVGVQPHVATITAATGFTVIGTAGDTSIYNYTMTATN